MTSAVYGKLLQSCALRHALNAVLACSFQDGIGVHLLCGLTAGLAATTLGSPWDVIGTRSRLSPV